MKDVRDRVPQNPNRMKITHADGSIEYVTIELADNPTVIGTPVNRDLFNDLQGFVNSKTTFNPDGSITETYGDTTVKTVFNADGSIDEIRTSPSGTDIKRTTFNPDGSISEVML